MRVSFMLGRLANGGEKDKGTRLHAIPDGSRKALCGAAPGPRSVGWKEDWGDAPKPGIVDVTCPKCRASRSWISANTFVLCIKAILAEDEAKEPRGETK